MLKSTTTLVAAGITLLSAHVASAADLNGGPRISMKDDAPAAHARACSGDRFAGFYAGVNGGLTALETKWQETFADFDDYQSKPLERRHAGFSGGGQIGYNRVRCNFLVGVEADYNFSNIGSGADHLPPQGPGLGYARISDHIKDYATLRGRMGFVADRTLFYATGGLAWANLRHELQDVGHFDGLTSPNPILNGWKGGWALGAGFEHALTEMISLKGEGMYMDFGKREYAFQDSAVPADPYAFRNHAGLWTARVGLNIKLGDFRRRADCDRDGCNAAPMK